MFDLAAVQSALREQGLDGWLLYDFRGSNPLARKVLGIADGAHTTRRYFYLIPASGEPKKLVHAIETGTLDHLPGKATIYLACPPGCSYDGHRLADDCPCGNRDVCLAGPFQRDALPDHGSYPATGPGRRGCADSTRHHRGARRPARGGPGRLSPGSAARARRRG